jgi:chaperone protein EcpD
MKLLARLGCACAWVAATVLAPAHAEVQINGTRVIYPADEAEVTVQVQNNGQTPRLLQVWTDGGDPNETVDTGTAPFLVTPPMSRLEPGKGQALRVMFTGSDVPQDRESVYWLNVLEMPPRPKSATAGDNFMQFAVRTRIKIFYRPLGLPGAPLDSIAQLTWRVVHDGGKTALECTNPTAYNVSFAEVRLQAAAREDMPKGGMCPAKGRAMFPVDGHPGAGTVVFTAINDHGGFVEGKATASN